MNNFDAVNAPFIKLFKIGEEPKDIIPNAMEAQLHSTNILNYLDRISTLYSHEILNNEAMFSILRNAAMKVPELDPFGIYRWEMAYCD